MGMIGALLNMLFGGGRNVVAETAEMFRENAEAGAERGAVLREQALQQFAAEFTRVQKGPFDRFMDGLNRLPRPAMALGVIGLIIAAMIDPVWFAARMQGLVLVPEPLWWLLGIVVSFYFGARHQAKGMEFQQSLAATMARVPDVVENLQALKVVEEPNRPDRNAALEDWRKSAGG